MVIVLVNYEIESPNINKDSASNHKIILDE